MAIINFMLTDDIIIDESEENEYGQVVKRVSVHSKGKKVIEEKYSISPNSRERKTLIIYYLSKKVSAGNLIDNHVVTSCSKNDYLGVWKAYVE